MRVLIDVTIPVEVGNGAVKDGRLPRTFAAVMDQLHPESAYFYPKNGKRHAQFVIDVNESSQIPVLAERFFQELNAAVELTPVMNYEDLQKGLGKLPGVK